MVLAESVVRVYVFYAVGAVAWMGVAALVGTIVGGALALLVGLVVLVCCTLAGLFLYARP
ncbi:hypothetical protein BRD14_00285 [Halobacteriales archaeon SW_5_68_122]|nr:MAG: hypothetical protein BRD14_00285 [Halobacteriales archaeon SW_5_68_122]